MATGLPPAQATPRLSLPAQPARRARPRRLRLLCLLCQACGVAAGAAPGLPRRRTAQPAPPPSPCSAWPAAHGGQRADVQVTALLKGMQVVAADVCLCLLPLPIRTLLELLQASCTSTLAAAPRWETRHVICQQNKLTSPSPRSRAVFSWRCSSAVAAAVACRSRTRLCRACSCSDRSLAVWPGARAECAAVRWTAEQKCAQARPGSSTSTAQQSDAPDGHSRSARSLACLLPRV